MCSWERFCAFAREPERRKVGGDARIVVEGTHYEVDADLAGEEVVLWWGLFDHELFVELGEKRYGPYRPAGGPIPLHRERLPCPRLANPNLSHHVSRIHVRRIGTNDVCVPHRPKQSRLSKKTWSVPHFRVIPPKEER
jgi:hypothetical protein